jgi:hypothetical protein
VDILALLIGCYERLPEQLVFERRECSMIAHFEVLFVGFSLAGPVSPGLGDSLEYERVVGVDSLLKKHAEWRTILIIAVDG